MTNRVVSTLGFALGAAELDTADRDAADSNGSQYRSLKIDETYNMNAIYLHELYFVVHELHLFFLYEIYVSE